MPAARRTPSQRCPPPRSSCASSARQVAKCINVGAAQPTEHRSSNRSPPKHTQRIQVLRLLATGIGDAGPYNAGHQPVLRSVERSGARRQLLLRGGTFAAGASELTTPFGSWSASCTTASAVTPVLDAEISRVLTDVFPGCSILSTSARRDFLVTSEFAAMTMASLGVRTGAPKRHLHSVPRCSAGNATPFARPPAGAIYRRRGNSQPRMCRHT